MTVSWYVVHEKGQFLLDGFNEFSSAFIKYQIVPYVLNFLVEILLILTYDLGSPDQAMNDSAFHVMWVVGLEVQITTPMNRFPVQFRN
jgi:hypothetical protein